MILYKVLNAIYSHLVPLTALFRLSVVIKTDNICKQNKLRLKSLLIVRSDLSTISSISSCPAPRLDTAESWVTTPPPPAAKTHTYSVCWVHESAHGHGCVWSVWVIPSIVCVCVWICFSLSETTNKQSFYLAEDAGVAEASAGFNAWLHVSSQCRLKFMNKLN